MKRVDVEFFKANPGYDRIFKAILKRYRSLGRIGGRVRLTNLTTKEREVLSNHLKKDLSNQRELSFAVLDFEKSLTITRFAEFSLEEILMAYFEIELISKKEEADIFREKRLDFFQDLAGRYRRSAAGMWLEKVLQEEAIGIIKVFQLYDSSPLKLTKQIEVVAKALELLEKRGERFWRLPVFASLLTADPHAFDQGTDLNKLLVDALCTILDLESPTSSEELGELLYSVGLLIDEVLNFVTCAGLLAYKNEKPHPVWQGALDYEEPLQIPLYNLTGLTRVKSPSDLVFVVENPAVFASILDAFAGEVLPPLICTAGQVKISGLILLDFLAKEGTKIYYSGDLDPEGLLIAQRLAKRYGDSLEYWRLDEVEYEQFLSNKNLSPLRLSKLKRITDPRLIPLAQRMEREGFASYQELILPDLIEDIRRNLEERRA